MSQESREKPCRLFKFKTSTHEHTEEARHRDGNARGLLGHDVCHLLADLLDLRSLGIGGLLELVLAPLGEGDAEEAQLVSIGRVNIDAALDGGLQAPSGHFSTGRFPLYEMLE